MGALDIFCDEGVGMICAMEPSCTIPACYRTSWCSGK
jgi:hypothetical protein